MQKTTSDKIGEIAGLAFRHRRLLTAGFFIISFAVLIAAWYMPRSFESFAVVLNDESKIIAPLLRGTAVPTSIRDRAETAGELIYSRKVLADVLTLGGWLDSTASPLVQETFIERSVKRRISVLTGEGHLVRIQFKDENPELAQRIAQSLAETYVSESRRLQMAESRAAFEFLDTQVDEYHVRLLAAEATLKRFNTENIDSQPGAEGMVIQRIAQLRNQSAGTNSELLEAQAKRDTLASQLGGEAAVTESMSRESELLGRVAGYQKELGELRLRFHDTYPDIVQLMSQIEQVERQIGVERQARAATGAIDIVATPNSPNSNGRSNATDVYGELRRNLQDVEVLISTLQARLRENKAQLAVALETGRAVQETSADLAELNRDYDTNKTIFDDLLTRRESARVSMNLDTLQQGQSARIFEPAFLPRKPSGLRFLHYLIGGLVLGTFLPVAMLVAFSYVDPRYRLPDRLAAAYEVPVVLALPHLKGPADKRRNSIEMVWLALVVGAVIALYVASGVARWYQIDVTQLI